MSRPRVRAATVYRLAAALALLALLGGGTYAWVLVRDCQAARAAQELALAKLRDNVAGLEAERDALVSELEAALLIGEQLSERVDGLQKDLEEARATRMEVRQIRGTADFPILRAMARGGDTLAEFAVREKTSEEIVRALNPWLGDDVSTLESWQTLWVPKPSKAE